MTRRRRAGLALGLAILIAGCGSASRTVTVHPVILDTERVERSIESSIFAQRHLRARVSCPAGIVQHKNAGFTCTATVGRRRYPVTVGQTDDSGHVRFVVR